MLFAPAVPFVPPTALEPARELDPALLGLPLVDEEPPRFALAPLLLAPPSPSSPRVNIEPPQAVTNTARTPAIRAMRKDMKAPPRLLGIVTKL